MNFICFSFEFFRLFDRADHISALRKQFNVLILILGGRVLVHAVVQLGRAGTRDLVVGLRGGRVGMGLEFDGLE